MSKAVFNNDVFPDTDINIINGIKKDIDSDISPEDKRRMYYYVVHTNDGMNGLDKSIKKVIEKGSFLWCYDIHDDMTVALPISRIKSINLLKG